MKKKLSLKEARAAKQWTWFMLAAKSGVSISTISRAEAAGGWPPTLDTRARLQRALDVPVA